MPSGGTWKKCGIWEKQTQFSTFPWGQNLSVVFRSAFGWCCTMPRNSENVESGAERSWNLTRPCSSVPLGLMYASMIQCIFAALWGLTHGFSFYLRYIYRHLTKGE